MVALIALQVMFIGIMVGAYILARCAEMVDGSQASGGAKFLAVVAAIVAILGILALSYFTVTQLASDPATSMITLPIGMNA